jgi:uncharacterized protein
MLSSHVTGDTSLNLQSLRRWFSEFKDGVIVAYSGGVDSTLLAVVAQSVLGPRSLAVLADSLAVARSEIKEAVLLAKKEGLLLRVVMQDDLADENYVVNEPDRCFHCRSALVDILRKVALEENMQTIIDGTNTDDIGTFRPGIKALRDGGARAPLVELGFGKKHVREMARLLSLSVHDKPANACLSSRIQYGQRISRETLERIEKAENFICDYLNVRSVRVRDHAGLARIELFPEDIVRITDAEKMKRIDKELRKLGFAYSTLDLQGYRSGSMNEILKSKPVLPLVKEQ